MIEKEKYATANVIGAVVLRGPSERRIVVIPYSDPKLFMERVKQFEAAQRGQKPQKKGEEEAQFLGHRESEETEVPSEVLYGDAATIEGAVRDMVPCEADVRRMVTTNFYSKKNGNYVHCMGWKCSDTPHYNGPADINRVLELARKHGHITINDYETGYEKTELGKSIKGIIEGLPFREHAYSKYYEYDGNWYTVDYYGNVRHHPNFEKNYRAAQSRKKNVVKRGKITERLLRHLAARQAQLLEHHVTGGAATLYVSNYRAELTKGQCVSVIPRLGEVLRRLGNADDKHHRSFANDLRRYREVLEEAVQYADGLINGEYPMRKNDDGVVRDEDWAGEEGMSVAGPKLGRFLKKELRRVKRNKLSEPEKKEDCDAEAA